MKATKNGWTIEGTPREIAELIGVVPACSLYETPEWNRIQRDRKAALKDFDLLHIAEAIRQEQAKVDKRLKECEELERRGKERK